MNLQYASFLPSDFHDNSRVWIYQSNRLFSIGEALELEEIFEDFVKNWNSHGAKVKGYVNLFFGQFIIIMADETSSGVSGCSTDSSVRMIKNIEQRYKVNMFDRQLLAFVIKERIQMLPLVQLKHAVENNFITPETLYFNNPVLTKKALLEKWIIPVKVSWLMTKIKSKASSSL